MSVTLILQNENKKTLGGYIWIFTSMSLAYVLTHFEIDFSKITNITSFISAFILFASFLSLAFITVRPEKFLNRFIFRFDVICDYFKFDNSLERIMDSPFIAKDRDNFWGNLLIGIGFITTLFIPLNKILEPELFITVELFRNVGCVVTAISIFVLWGKNQRMELKVRIEIVWRYYSIISHTGWKEVIKDEVKELEESLKIGNWEKAKNQTEELNLKYERSINEFFEFIGKLYTGLQFFHLNVSYASRLERWMKDRDGQSVELEKRFLQEVIMPLKSRYIIFEKELNQFREIFSKVTILGLEYQNSRIADLLRRRVSDFNVLQKKYEEYIPDLRKERDTFLTVIKGDSDLADETKNRFSSMMGQFDFSLFHLENVLIDIPESSDIMGTVASGGSELVRGMFTDITTSTDLFAQLCENKRSSFEYYILTALDLPSSEEQNFKSEQLEISDWISSLPFFKLR